MTETLKTTITFKPDNRDLSSITLTSLARRYSEITKNVEIYEVDIYLDNGNYTISEVILEKRFPKFGINYYTFNYLLDRREDLDNRKKKLILEHQKFDPNRILLVNIFKTLDKSQILENKIDILNRKLDFIINKLDNYDLRMIDFGDILHKRKEEWTEEEKEEFKRRWRETTKTFITN